MILLDGKATAEKIYESLKEKVASLKPCMAVMMIGENPASKVYVRNKARACEKVGIEYKEFLFPESVTQEEVLEAIENINQDASIHGLIVQLPVPAHIYVPDILKAIDPKKDVDGFTAYNTGKMVASPKFEDLPPATPGGMIRLLETYNINPSGMDIVVLGRSNIVGKPIANMLINRGATVTVCNSKTKNLSFYTRNADMIVAAIGVPKFLKADQIKDGVIILDVGMNHDEHGQLCGDTDFENIKEKCSYITPVPGGVGPMTIAQLMINVIHAAEKQKIVI